jgi:gas vesicle protein
MNTPWQKKTQSDYATILMAVLAGAGAGLTVGLLMAPKSGDRLRADIGTAVDEYLDSARQKAGELRTSATNLAQKGLREVQRAKDTAAEKVSGAFSHAVDTGAKEAHGAIDDTVANVNSAAKKGHNNVDSAADALRTGTRA